MVGVEREAWVIRYRGADRLTHASLGREQSDADRLLVGAHAAAHGESAGAAQRRRPSVAALLPVDLLLEQHVAAEFAVLGPVAAIGIRLARRLRQVGIHF